jgi:hypothetical protein
MDEISRIMLEKIIDRTKNGRATWAKADGDEFKINLSNGVIKVSAVTSNSGNNKKNFFMSVCDNKGKIVSNYDTLSLSGGHKDFTLLQELYNSAKMRYDGAYEVLSAIIHEINGPGALGDEMTNSEGTL